MSGVATAVATRLAVSTQAIWSCDADSAPCICGSDTFAMVTVIAYRKVTAVQVPSTSARRSAAPVPVSSASGIACTLIRSAL